MSVTSPVRPGANATATVSTAPSAQCEITVTYKSGPSEGQVSWAWMVGTNTTPGAWPIDVTCTGAEGPGSVTTHFEIAR